MGDTAILIWLGAVSVIGVNGFAAGIAAMLYIWRRRIGKSGRALLAALAAGLVPAVMVGGIGLIEEGFSGDGPFMVALAFGVFALIGSVVALPGAILVARSIEQPSDDYRFFE